MTQTTPSPVRNFFARFLANPNAKGLRDFCFDLLDLEISRADYNVFCDWPLVEASETYKSDMDLADRALSSAVRSQWLSHEDLDLPYFWLTLMGHRLAVERGLSTGGVDVLAHVACERLNLPLKETELWSDDVLFAKYTQTVLREEWDYPGLLFRLPVTPPPDR